eukprot:249957-Chlamydomonas_euryale.AAC.2
MSSWLHTSFHTNVPRCCSSAVFPTTSHELGMPRCSHLQQCVQLLTPAAVHSTALKSTPESPAQPHRPPAEQQ